jgi:hypothetical protein
MHAAQQSPYVAGHPNDLIRHSLHIRIAYMRGGRGKGNWTPPAILADAIAGCSECTPNSCGEID